MNIGDIYWVDAPARGGHTQAGRRPGLLVPLTTQQDALRFPGTVLINPDATNGLRRASVALVFQLAAVDQRFVMERIGNASSATMEAIWAAVNVLTERQGEP